MNEVKALPVGGTRFQTMNYKIARHIGLVLFLAFSSLFVSAQVSPHDLYVGTWKGEMNLGRAVPVEFVFERSGNVLKGFAVEPSGERKPLAQVMGFDSGTVFRLDRDEATFMVFTGQLGADKSSLTGEVTIMEGKVERGKAPWKAKKVVAAQPAPASPTAGQTPVQAAEARGRTLLSKKDHDGAIKAYSECLKLEPSQPFCLAGRALSYLGAGKYKEAIADFNVSIKAMPKPPAQAYLNRAQAKIGLDDYDGAVADAELAFAVNRTPDAHLTRGEAFQRKGGDIYFSGIFAGTEGAAKAMVDGRELAAKGLAEFNKFIQLKPQDHRGYWQRGVYYFQLWNIFQDNTRLRDGLADLEKAISLAPQNADIFYSRYEIHAALGNKAAADADRAKYHELSKK